MKGSGVGKRSRDTEDQIEAFEFNSTEISTSSSSSSSNETRKRTKKTTKRGFTTPRKSEQKANNPALVGHRDMSFAEFRRLSNIFDGPNPPPFPRSRSRQASNTITDMKGSGVGKKRARGTEDQIEAFEFNSTLKMDNDIPEEHREAFLSLLEQVSSREERGFGCDMSLTFWHKFACKLRLDCNDRSITAEMCMRRLKTLKEINRSMKYPLRAYKDMRNTVASLPQDYLDRISKIFNCKAPSLPPSPRTSSSASRSNSLGKRKSGDADSSSGMEEWQKELQTAVIELVQSDDISIVDVLKVENSLFKSVHTAHVFLGEKEKRKRVTMLKELVAATDTAVPRHF